LKEQILAQKSKKPKKSVDSIQSIKQLRKGPAIYKLPSKAPANIGAPQSENPAIRLSCVHDWEGHSLGALCMSKMCAVQMA
jgi:hypothetical protein